MLENGSEGFFFPSSRAPLPLLPPLISYKDPFGPNAPYMASVRATSPPPIPDITINKSPNPAIELATDDTELTAQSANSHLAPPGAAEEPLLYVNSKQFHRILKRRAARQKLEQAIWLTSKGSKPYLHESRPKRGPGGGFLAADEMADMEEKGGLSVLFPTKSSDFLMPGTFCLYPKDPGTYDVAWDWRVLQYPQDNLDKSNFLHGTQHKDFYNSPFQETNEHHCRLEDISAQEKSDAVDEPSKTRCNSYDPSCSGNLKSRMEHRRVQNRIAQEEYRKLRTQKLKRRLEALERRAGLLSDHSKQLQQQLDLVAKQAIQSSKAVSRIESSKNNGPSRRSPILGRTSEERKYPYDYNNATHEPQYHSVWYGGLSYIARLAPKAASQTPFYLNHSVKEPDDTPYIKRGLETLFSRTWALELRNSRIFGHFLPWTILASAVRADQPPNQPADQSVSPTTINVDRTASVSDWGQLFGTHPLALDGPLIMLFGVVFVLTTRCLIARKKFKKIQSLKWIMAVTAYWTSVVLVRKTYPASMVFT